MWLFEKSLDEVTEADLQALVDSGFDKDEEGAQIDFNAAQTLKPAIDAVWNACGHRESKNYHGGKWSIQ